MVDLVLFNNRGGSDSWETTQRTLFSIPFFPINKASGRARPDLPPITAYSIPIQNPETGTLEVVAFFDEGADNTGQTIITLNEAKSRGFFKTPDLPFGNLLVTVSGTQQNGIADTYVKINQFDSTTLNENLTVDIPNGTLTILQEGEYDLSYEITFVGEPIIIYDFSLFVNDIEIRGSQFSTEFQSGRKTGADTQASLVAGDIIDWRVKTQTGRNNSLLVQKAQLVIEAEEPI